MGSVYFLHDSEGGIQGTILRPDFRGGCLHMLLSIPPFFEYEL